MGIGEQLFGAAPCLVDLFALQPVTLRRTWHHQNRRGRGRLNDDQLANPVSPTVSPMINVLKVDRFGLIECDLQQHFMSSSRSWRPLAKRRSFYQWPPSDFFLDADNQAGAARHLVVQKPKPGRIGFVRTSLRHDI